MELNGTLHEYLLADVFQLLSQQNATGRLEVRNGDDVGFMILNEGMIVFAQELQDNPVTKLAAVLKSLRRIADKDLQKLVVTHANAPSKFVKELVTRECGTDEEFSMAVRVTVEDISCSLFSWSTGTYRFDSIKNVKAFVIPGVILPADSVVMEAMRRDDEAKRLFAQIEDDTIFVPTSREHDLGAFPKTLAEMYHQPDSFILSYVDGLTSVSTVVKQSGLCWYRTCETLVRLWQSNLVAPLPTKLSQSIQAAMVKGDRGGSEKVRALAMAFGGSLLVVLVIIFLGAFVFQRVLMRTKMVESSAVRSEIELTQSAQKAQIAVIQFRTEHGRPPTSASELVVERYLTHEDLAPLSDAGLDPLTLP